jgi:alkanesulfonate monooxygenase SsuD/methylene tetrahydromethanopterin reductase-like flavin-dependent oxidoreductase (luciferase family)
MPPRSLRTSFGVFLTNLHGPGEDLAQRLSEHREQVQLARDCGFSSVAVGHHFLTQPLSILAPIPHLASLVDISGSMRLVLGVMLLPLVNPVPLAEEIATLDWLSGGRVVFGAGIGYRPEEFAAIGVSTRERVGRFNECFEVIRRIWSAEPTWSFEGRHFKYGEAPGGLKPKQRPHPPLWVATDVDAAVRRAGRLGAAWYINPRAKLESLRPQLDVYRAALAEHGNTMPDTFPIRREAFVAETDADARQMAVTYLKRMLAIYESWGQYRVMPGADVRDRSFGAADIPDTYLVGTPERVADLVTKYVETLGVNHFILRMQWPGMPNAAVMKSLELAGDRLISAFR